MVEFLRGRNHNPSPTAQRASFCLFGSIVGSLPSSARLQFSPEMIIRWHRAGFRSYWRGRSRKPVGRPRISAELRNDNVPAALLPCDSASRTSTVGIVRGDDKSDGGVDCALDHRGVSLGRVTSITDATH